MAAARSKSSTSSVELQSSVMSTFGCLENSLGYWQIFQAHEKEIVEQLAATTASGVPQYKELNCLDVEVASRNRQNTVEPSFLLELVTTGAKER